MLIQACTVTGQVENSRARCIMHTPIQTLTDNGTAPGPNPYQREAQLEDDADYQTAHQSARTMAVNGGLRRPIASLMAGQSHRPTVDGMEEVRGSSPLISTAKVLVRAHLILRDV
jgi:hypothetical protein